MLNLIRADLYRYLRRPAYLAMIAVPLMLLLLGSLLVVVLDNKLFQAGDGGELLALVMTSYPTLGIWFVLMAGDLCFSDEYQHGTLKNAAAFGYRRAEIYFARLLSSLIYSVVALILLLSLGYTILWSIFGGAWEELGLMIKWTGLQLLYALPLWMGFLSLANALLFYFRRDWSAGLLFAVLVFLPSTLFSVMAQVVNPIFGILRGFLPSIRLSQVGQMAWGRGDMMLNWAIGLAFVVLTSGIGVVLFQRRELH